MRNEGSLTPNELRNQVFQTRMRGYDRQEVSAVLDEVAGLWEELTAENLRLREKNAALEAQVKKYAELEQTLRDTLVVARRAAEDEAATAKKQAELVIEQARLKAEAIIREAEGRAEEHRREMLNLQATRSRLQAEMRAMLRSFAEQLERFDMAGEPRPKAMKSPATRPSDATGRGREAPSTGAPSQTFVVPPQRERQAGQDEHAADFDATLSKIFGDEVDSSEPTLDDSLFGDDATFEQAPAKQGGQEPDASPTDRKEKEKDW